MSLFRFRLKTLLTLRETARDERRGQLAEAYLAEQRLRERRGAVEGELNDLKKLCQQSCQPGQVDVDRLVTANRFEAVLKAEVHVIHQHEATLAVEIEKRRQALVVADREVRVLEKLREAQRDRHRQTEAAILMKQLDEVGGRRAGLEELSQ